MKEKIFKCSARAERFVLLMATHFPDVRPGDWEKLKCENCLDLKRADCPGKNLKEDDVLLCMKEKIENTIIECHSGLVSANFMN